MQTGLVDFSVIFCENLTGFCPFNKRIVYGEFLVRSKVNISDLILEFIPEMYKFLTNLTPTNAGENLKSWHMGNGQKWFAIAVSHPFNESNNITVNQIHPRRSVPLLEFNLIE
jgi:hypothetical protein